MATLRTIISDIAGEHRQGLCPVCHSGRMTIRTNLDVLYEVEAVRGSDELAVVDERLAGSGWDEEDMASCSSCGWHGQVSDLSR